MEVLPKLQFFAWQLLQGKLPTRERLARWDSSISPISVLFADLRMNLQTICSFTAPWPSPCGLIYRDQFHDRP